MRRKKPVKSSQSSSLTVGCELELQVVNPKTFNLTSLAPNILQLTQPQTANIKSEIFQTRVEVETESCSDVHEVNRELEKTKRILLEAAEQSGAKIAAAGNHPFAMASKPLVAPRKTIFGLHVRVGAADPEQGLLLYRFYLSIAPLLLAISSSSPFLQGQLTGLHSVRSIFFEGTSAGGNPPILESWSEFEGLMTKLLKSKAIGSHQDLWWDVKPSLNYMAIEVRISDAMTTVHQNAALVSFIHLLGYAFLNSKDYKEWPFLAEWSYRENKWRAIRHGLDFDFIFNEQGASRPAREYGLSLLNDLEGFVEELGYQNYANTLRGILLGQTAADKMIAVYEETQDFKSVVKWYCDQLSAT
jgi:carboxylate-amine ligase